MAVDVLQARGLAVDILTFVVLDEVLGKAIRGGINTAASYIGQHDTG